jgi:hypothetical protein
MIASHIRLFKHFKVEHQFTMQEAMQFLNCTEGYFARVVRTDARKHARRDCEGYYLCCCDNSKDRFMFSKNPSVLTQQFKRGRGIHMGQRTTLLELMEVMFVEGCADDAIDVKVWSLRWQANHWEDLKNLDIEKRERRLMKAERLIKAS